MLEFRNYSINAGKLRQLRLEKSLQKQVTNFKRSLTLEIDCFFEQIYSNFKSQLDQEMNLPESKETELMDYFMQNYAKSERKITKTLKKALYAEKKEISKKTQESVSEARNQSRERTQGYKGKNKHKEFHLGKERKRRIKPEQTFGYYDDENTSDDEIENFGKNVIVEKESSVKDTGEVRMGVQDPPSPVEVQLEQKYERFAGSGKEAGGAGEPGSSSQSRSGRKRAKPRPKQELLNPPTSADMVVSTPLNIINDETLKTLKNEEEIKIDDGDDDQERRIIDSLKRSPQKREIGYETQKAIKKPVKRVLAVEEIEDEDKIAIDPPKMIAQRANQVSKQNFDIDIKKPIEEVKEFIKGYYKSQMAAGGAQGGREASKNQQKEDFFEKGKMVLSAYWDEDQVEDLMNSLKEQAIEEQRKEDEKKKEENEEGEKERVSVSGLPLRITERVEEEDEGVYGSIDSIPRQLNEAIQLKIKQQEEEREKKLKEVGRYLKEGNYFIWILDHTRGMLGTNRGLYSFEIFPHRYEKSQRINLTQITEDSNITDIVDDFQGNVYYTENKSNTLCRLSVRSQASKKDPQKRGFNIYTMTSFNDEREFSTFPGKQIYRNWDGSYLILRKTSTVLHFFFLKNKYLSDLFCDFSAYSGIHDHGDIADLFFQATEMNDPIDYSKKKNPKSYKKKKGSKEGRRKDKTPSIGKEYSVFDTAGRVSEECCILTNKGYLYRIEGFSEQRGVDYLAIRCRERSQGVDYTKFLIDFKAYSQQDEEESTARKKANGVSFRAETPRSVNKNGEGEEEDEDRYSGSKRSGTVIHDMGASSLLKKHPEFENHTLAGKIEIGTNQEKIVCCRLHNDNITLLVASCRYSGVEGSYLVIYSVDLSKNDPILDIKSELKFGPYSRDDHHPQTIKILPMDDKTDLVVVCCSTGASNIKILKFNKSTKLLKKFSESNQLHKHSTSWAEVKDDAIWTCGADGYINKIEMKEIFG